MPVGLLDMAAVSNDSGSEFEMFGRTFDSNVKLTVDPEMSPQNDVIFPYLHDTHTGALEATGLGSSPANSTGLQFFTTSLTRVVLLSVPLSTLSQWIEIGNIDTGFTPLQNGWLNLADSLWPTYNGMTIFARWFYVTKIQPLQTASREWSTDTVDRLLTLLQVRCSNPPPRPDALSDAETVQVLVHALYVSHSPQLLWMEKSDGLGVLPGHAVLVYKYRMGVFYFYDPQFGAEEQTLSFDSSTNTFVPYYNGGYNRFYVYSHQAFQLTDTDMETVYNLTFNEFLDTRAPEIILDPFTDNITGGALIVSGVVVPKPGQPLPAALFSYVFSNDSEGRAISRGRAAIDSSGRFSKVFVDIDLGVSKIVFIAGGYVVTRDSDRTRRSFLPLSYGSSRSSLYYGHGYSQSAIYSSGNPNLLTVTLTWDDGASDVDLHILEPGGRHIYYANPGGGGTPFLDYDNTRGYGPEHYFVNYGFQAAVGTLEGTYKIRIHYYRNKMEKVRSIRWTVRVEGTTQESTLETTGILQRDNSGANGNFYSSDSSWSPMYEVNLQAVHFIAIADRRLDNTPGIVYHYSAQLWKNVLVLPKKQTEEEVSYLRKLNPAATKEGGVELLAEGSSSSCNYRGWLLRQYLVTRSDCWKDRSVSVSRIRYEERGTKYIPVFLDSDWGKVEAKWNEIVHLAQNYPYAEQTGRPINKYPQSIYCIGDDVNNSNTFIRWLFGTSGVNYREMRLLHPGRNFPVGIPVRSFQGPLFCASAAPPPLTTGSQCQGILSTLPTFVCI